MIEVAVSSTGLGQILQTVPEDVDGSELQQVLKHPFTNFLYCVLFLDGPPDQQKHC